MCHSRYRFDEFLECRAVGRKTWAAAAFTVLALLGLLAFLVRTSKAADHSAIVSTASVKSPAKKHVKKKIVTVAPKVVPPAVDWRGRPLRVR